MANSSSGRFAKLSTDLWTNVKWLSFAEEHAHAALVWVTALSYCADRLTDGYFDRFTALRMFAATPDDLDALVESGFIEEHADGYVIHDYADYQNASVDFDDLRLKRSESGKRGAAARWGNRHGDGKKMAIAIEKPMAKPMANAMANRWQSDGKPMASENLPYGNAMATTDLPYGNHDFCHTEQTVENIEENGKTDGKIMANEWQTDGKAMANEWQSDGNAIADKDIDIEIDNKSPLIFPPLPTDFQEKRELLEKVFDQIRNIYPTNKYDGDKSTTRFDLEMNYPRIARVAVKAGYENPFEFLIARVKAYLAATKPRYVKKLSRFIVQEEYATDWKPEAPQPTKAEARFAANLSLGAAFAQADTTVSEFTQIGAA